MDHHHSRDMMFNVNKFDDWKVLMQSHLLAIHDEMRNVITDRPIEILEVNPNRVVEGPSAAEMIPKPKASLTFEERTRSNLNNIARDKLYKALNESLFPR